jgi:hypothetical protein
MFGFDLEGGKEIVNKVQVLVSGGWPNGKG